MTNMGQVRGDARKRLEAVAAEDEQAAQLKSVARRLLRDRGYRAEFEDLAAWEQLTWLRHAAWLLGG